MSIKSGTDNQAPDSTEWMNVAHTTATEFDVTGYFKPNGDPDQMKLNEEPEGKILLKPATLYKFRVAGVNSLGQGPWSDVSAFMTSDLLVPPAPTRIKIKNNSDGGATLNWETPIEPTNTGSAPVAFADVLEYSVYLAMKTSTPGLPEPNPDVKQGNIALNFTRVYNGPHTSCVVSSSLLEKALVDTTTPTPAILFRVAAAGSNGSGPATQVRWLQKWYEPAVLITESSKYWTGPIELVT